jgi:hypothetical protein
VRGQWTCFNGSLLFAAAGTRREGGRAIEGDRRFAGPTRRIQECHRRPGHQAKAREAVKEGWRSQGGGGGRKHPKGEQSVLACSPGDPLYTLYSVYWVILSRQCSAWIWRVYLDYNQDKSLPKEKRLKWKVRFRFSHAANQTTWQLLREILAKQPEQAKAENPEVLWLTAMEVR